MTRAAKLKTSDTAKGHFPAIHREMKLGEALMAKIRGTSLDSAAEMDELIMLNRGAPQGEMTPTVKQLVEDAAVGKEVSAIAETARRQKRPPKPQHASAIPRAAYSITEFCQAHGFSEWTYFCMKREGLGPTEFAVRARRLISFELAAAWRKQRERETANADASSSAA